jgi:methionyl-tRNA formyltransferase
MQTVVFLGSKPIGYQCFEHLLIQSSQLGIKVTGLLTQQRKEFGGEHNLESLAAVHNVPVFSDPDEIPACDILYSVQYHRILTAAQLMKATVRAVNLHMAPLPEYRGANQFSFAILEGKKEFGTTIHLMDPRIDHGDILFQKRFPIPDSCWVHELYHKTETESFELFRESLDAVINGPLDPVPQQTLISDRGTSLHFKKEMSNLKLIDLSASREQIERQLRATYMPGFEPPYLLIGNRKVHLIPDQSS